MLIVDQNISRCVCPVFMTQRQ